MRFRIVVKGMPLFTYLKGMPSFLKEYSEIRCQARKSEENFPFGPFYPCLEDRYQESGNATGHYFHQDLLVANRIFVNNPIRHVDIGSRIDGLVAHVASFREIKGAGYPGPDESRPEYPIPTRRPDGPGFRVDRPL